MASPHALLFVVGLCACGPSAEVPGDPQPTSTSGTTAQPTSSTESPSDDTSSTITGTTNLESSSSTGTPAPSCTIDYAAKPTATLVEDGTEIELLPSGIRFTVPTLVQEASTSTFLLSENDLLTAEDGQGEWTTEYAAVANALLPFDRCGAHFGDDLWPVASSFFALWTRAYIFEESIIELEASFLDNAAAAVEAAGGTSPEVSQTMPGPWRKTQVDFDLFFRDYGGEATVEMHIREYGPYRIAFVFMHSLGSNPGSEGPIDEVLDSVCVSDGAGGCCEPE